jgi:hypothetical protein
METPAQLDGTSTAFVMQGFRFDSGCGLGDGGGCHETHLRVDAKVLRLIRLMGGKSPYPSVSTVGDVAHLVRAPLLQSGGNGFESRLLHW